VLRHGEGEEEVGKLRIARLPFGHDLQSAVGDDAVVARLDEEPARERAEGRAFGHRIGQAAGEKEPQILLLGDDRFRFGARIRRDDDLGENLDDLARGLGVERAVERDDPAEGADRIASVRLVVSLAQRLRGRDPARVRVLDDGDGG
jgi:hypothetical protein